MGNNFLVLGLPRSRTAWLSNFLTYGDITCTHEGLSGCLTLEEYRAKFRKNSGDSNTGLAAFDFEPLFPDFKVIVIDNAIDAAVVFSKTHYNVDLTNSMVTLKARLDSLKGLHIPYHSINDELETIWNYVSCDQFNDGRAKMLIDLNVQIRDPLKMDQESCVQLLKNTKNCF